MNRYVVYIIIDSGVITIMNVLDNKAIEGFPIDPNTAPQFVRERIALLNLLDNTNESYPIGIKLSGGSMAVWLNYKEYKSLKNEYAREKSKG